MIVCDAAPCKLATSANKEVETIFSGFNHSNSLGYDVCATAPGIAIRFRCAAVTVAHPEVPMALEGLSHGFPPMDISTADCGGLGPREFPEYE